MKKLTFEINSTLDEIEIHANFRGLSELKKLIDNLLETETNDHEHLMTQEWAGTELSSEKYGETNTLINKVTIYKWGE